jgi:hypothetical protein
MAGTTTRGPLALLGHPFVRNVVLGVFVVGFAVFAGMQIASPDKRVIQVLAALILVFFAFRIDSVSALAIATLFLPFPKATSCGNTNVTFVLLIFIVWLFRVTTKRIAPPQKIPALVPVGLLVVSYLISFYNVEAAHIAVAWSKFLGFLSYLFLAYMVVSVVRTEADVRKLLTTQLISCVLVCLFGIYELGHAGTVLIPGWIEFTDTLREAPASGARSSTTSCSASTALSTSSCRSSCSRATSKSRKFTLALCLMLTIFCLFATVTRGALRRCSWAPPT